MTATSLETPGSASVPLACRSPMETSTRRRDAGAPRFRESSHASRQTAPRRMLFALLVSAALCAEEVFIPAWAAEAPRTNASAGRYLFIVDTSFSMHRRAANTRKVAGDLLLSGLNGQLRPGDTIGVWTFNEKLNAG